MPKGIGWLPTAPGRSLWPALRPAGTGDRLGMLELASWTGSERFRAAALEAIAYERTLFVPEAKNSHIQGPRTTPDRDDSASGLTS